MQQERETRQRAAERERALQQRKEDGQQRRTGQRQPDGQTTDSRVTERATRRHQELQQARTRLSMEQRRRLHRAFDLRRAHVRNARFDHHVGRRIPRHVRLYPVPRTVLSFFPYYRDYSYVVVDDEICIVDPQTYAVVDVIEESYFTAPRPQVARLSLSESQIELVRSSVPPDFPEADVRLRLALGAEIPSAVRLHEFPDVVLNEVSVLRDYRFLVTRDQIVIVQPGDRSIAMVIDRR